MQLEAPCAFSIFKERQWKKKQTMVIWHLYFLLEPQILDFEKGVPLIRLERCSRDHSKLMSKWPGHSLLVDPEDVTMSAGYPLFFDENTEQ